MTAAEIAAALGKPHRGGRGWKCLCPCHDDHDPSLSVVEKDGKLLVTCRAGCTQTAVVDELRKRGLWMNGHDRAAKLQIVAAYNYDDEDGRLLFQVCRFSPKNFRQRRPDGVGGWIWRTEGTRMVPYRRHPHGAISSSRVGGGREPRQWRAMACVRGRGRERRRSPAEPMGLTATCNPGGSGKWRSDYNKYFSGADVIVISDNDDAGRTHAHTIAASLYQVAASVRILELPDLPPKGDLSDWLDRNPDAMQSDFETLVENTDPFKLVTEAALGFSLISAADLVSREFKEPKWAVPQMIGEGLTILAGKPKTGKSWAALDFAAAVAGGYQALGNINCQQGNVLLLALGDNDRRLHQRLKAVLQDQPAPSRLQIATR